MKLLGAKSRECLIIEDSLIGVQSAKKADVEVTPLCRIDIQDADRNEINRLTDDTFRISYLESEKRGKIKWYF